MTENVTPPTSKLSRKEKLRLRFEEKMKNGELTEFSTVNTASTAKEPEPVLIQEPLTEPLTEPSPVPVVELPEVPPVQETSEPTVDVYELKRQIEQAQAMLQDLTRLQSTLAQTARDAIQLRTEYQSLKDATFNDAISYLDQVVQRKNELGAGLDKWVAHLKRHEEVQRKQQRQHLVRLTVAALVSGLVSATLVLLVS